MRLPVKLQSDWLKHNYEKVGLSKKESKLLRKLIKKGSVDYLEVTNIQFSLKISMFII